MRGLFLTMWMKGLLVAMWMASLRAAPAVDKDLGKGRLCQYQVDKEGDYLEIDCVEGDMCRSMPLVPPSLGSISLEVWITGVAGAGALKGGRSRLRLCSRLQYAPAQSPVFFPDFLQHPNLPIFPQLQVQAGEDKDEEGKIAFPDLPIPQLDDPEDNGDTFDDVTDEISKENEETLDFVEIFEKTFGFGENVDESFAVSEETSEESVDGSEKQSDDSVKEEEEVDDNDTAFEEVSDIGSTDTAESNTLVTTVSVLELEEEFSVSEEAFEDDKEAMIDTEEANVEKAMVDTEEANIEEAMVDTKEAVEDVKEAMETVDEVEVSEDITGLVDSKTAVGADGLFDSLDLLSQAVAFITE